MQAKEPRNRRKPVDGDGAGSAITSESNIGVGVVEVDISVPTKMAKFPMVQFNIPADRDMLSPRYYVRNILI